MTQTVVFSKLEGSWTLAKARRWLREHGLAHANADETTRSWRFRQLDPGKCAGHFRTLTRGFPRGVALVTCEVTQADARERR